MLNQGLTAVLSRFVQNAKCHVYIQATGGAVDALGKLWSIAGASSVLLGGRTPYNTNMTDLLLGYKVKSYASQETAIALANLGYLEAQEILLRGGECKRPILSVAASAALATNRQRRGSDRIHLALRCEGANLLCANIVLDKALSRAEQGAIGDALLLNLILSGASSKQHPISEKRLESKELYWSKAGFLLKPQQVVKVVTEKADLVAMDINGAQVALSAFNPKEHILFPGSFDPLTFAHHKVAKMAEIASGKKVIFEISGQREDKSPISMPECEARAFQFRGLAPVILSANSALYIDKLRRYGISDLVLGTDAAMRLIDVKYYANSESARDAVFKEFELAGTTFYVVRRKLNSAKTPGLEQYIPKEWLHLFKELPGAWDVSSTMFRKA